MQFTTQKTRGHKKIILAAALLFLIGSAFCQNNLPFTKGFDMLTWFEQWDWGKNWLPNLNKYDETDFSCLKSMGVDVIRLPVHFDLLMEPYETGTIKDIVLEKLDEVCDWAEKYQIYLVIDNHSFNDAEHDENPPSTQLYKEHLRAVWTQVAQRYKNRSEYIIYEILNEPPAKVAQSDWTKITQETIDIIRQIDSKHSIVVTCTNWSDEDDLVKMKPFKDKNLIYTFHFYEPGFFTAQGLNGWASEIKDLPFPYDKSRMPELSENLADWIKNDLQTIYPQEGTEKYLNNQIKKVASWAKKNKVNVWAGEIGVGARSMPIDRLICIRTIVKALKDNNIPYCVWGIDSNHGILKTGDDTMLFPDDIDKYALEAYGFTMPDESLVAKTNISFRNFPQEPYAIYEDIGSKGIRKYLWGSLAEIQYDESHNYCFKISYPSQENGLKIFIPKQLTSKVAENKSSLCIKMNVKFSAANQEFSLNFLDSDDGEEKLPWAVTVPVKASDYKVGEWVTIEIPLSKFTTERDAWSDKTQKSYEPQGKFDWTRIENIWFDFNDYDNMYSGNIYIDDIVIKKK